MLSGVIFVALALLWALFLIPKALRSHDEAARPRSVESSDHARVLSRAQAAPTEIVTAVDVQAEADPAPAPSIPEQRLPTARVVAERQRRLAAAAAGRRRRVLGVLLVATAVVGVLAATHVLLPWAPAVPVAVVAGFLVVARVTVRAERARWDEVRARLADSPAAPAEATEPASQSPAQSPAQSAAQPAAQVPQPVRQRPVLVEVARNEQGCAVVSEAEDTSAFSAEALAEAVASSEVPAGSTLWDPLPVTLPTYVGKPRATRSVRTIDLQAAGVSSSGRNAADSALVAESATATPADQDLPGRRAVGG
jgi:hypothetical protein